MLPNAAENFTISTGVRLVPGVPPIVPLIPEMLLINATTNSSKVNDYIRLIGITKIRIEKGIWVDSLTLIFDHLNKEMIS